MNDLSSVTLSPAPSAVPSPSTTASCILTVAEALQPDLAQGFQIDSLRLRLEMERAFGGSDAVGAWDWKLAYEAGADPARDRCCVLLIVLPNSRAQAGLFLLRRT